MIHQLLKQLNFGDKEIEIYLAILEHRKISPTDIAKITKINRTTVYSVAKELKKKGVIAEDLGHATTYYTALPLKELKQLAAHEEKQLENKKVIIENAIKELAVLPKAEFYAIPKIRFIDEAELSDFLYAQTPVWNEAMLKTDSTWWGFQDSSVIKYHEDWINWYWKNAPKKIYVKVISNSSKIEEEMKKRKYSRRKVKFWKSTFNFSATTWVVGDRVVMVVTNHKPHYLVEIHDAVLASNMRELFRSIWEDLENKEKKGKNKKID